MSRRQGPRNVAAVLVTGDELLEGDVVDRNTRQIVAELVRRGFVVAMSVVLPDDRDRIVTFMQIAIGLGARLIVASGGMGSQPDDVMVASVCDLLGCPRVLDVELLREIRENRGTSRGLQEYALDAEERQARIPQGATWIRPRGSAPALVVPRLGTIPAVLVTVPGPPSEVKALLPEALDSPYVSSLVEGATPRERRVLRFWGTDESALDETLRQAMAELDLGQLSINACFQEVGAGELVMTTAFPSERVDASISASRSWRPPAAEWPLGWTISGSRCAATSSTQPTITC